MLDTILIDQNLHAKRWVVGLSGGVDSVVLLHLLTQVDNHPPIVALHINHQMQPEATRWESFCSDYAKTLNLAFVSRSVDVDSGGNVEEKAREARYKVFSDLCCHGDVLMLGHHQQDQTETFFYRLFRGAGVKGLAGMPKQRLVRGVMLLRPMLNVPKAIIEHYAQSQGLAFIVDPSNEDMRFDRNFIRHKLLPQVSSRWPAIDQHVTQTARRMRDAETCLMDLAKIDLANTDPLNDFEPSIDFTSLMSLSRARLDNALRFWLSSFGIRMRSKQLDVLKAEVIAAGQDAMPVLTIDGWIIRRYRTRLYLTQIESSQKMTHWKTSAPLVIEPRSYHVSIAVNENFSIRYADEIKRIKLSPKRRTQSVKQIYQALGVPPWRRLHTPWFFLHDALIAVGEYLITEAGEARFGQNFTISVQHSTDFYKKN